jgi:hypothetical protein
MHARGGRIDVDEGGDDAMLTGPLQLKQVGIFISGCSGSTLSLFSVSGHRFVCTIYTRASRFADCRRTCAGQLVICMARDAGVDHR